MARTACRPDRLACSMPPKAVASGFSAAGGSSPLVEAKSWPEIAIRPPRQAEPRRRLRPYRDKAASEERRFGRRGNVGFQVTGNGHDLGPRRLSPLGPDL